MADYLSIWSLIACIWKVEETWLKDMDLISKNFRDSLTSDRNPG